MGNKIGKFISTPKLTSAEQVCAYGTALLNFQDGYNEYNNKAKPKTPGEQVARDLIEHKGDKYKGKGYKRR